MSVAQRPEECPAMRVMIIGGFHQATETALTFEADGSANMKSLAIPSARPQTDSRSASDVIRALWLRKPKMSRSYFELRRAALPHDVETVIKTLRDLDEAMSNYIVESNDIVAGTALPIRHLRINDGQVTAEQLIYVAALLYGHANVASLALQANLIRPARINTMQSFAIAASLSNLRHIELSNNTIGTRSICQLLENLAMPSLTRLYLSMTMRRVNLAEDQARNELWTSDEDQSWRQRNGDEVWMEEIQMVTNLIVRLVQPQPGTMPYCPRLSLLSLNGNDLDWPSVKRIVSAVQNGSRALEEVGLFSTMDDSQAHDQDEDEDEADGEQARNTTRRRVTSIGTYMYENARNRDAATPAAHDRLGYDVTPHEHANRVRSGNPSVRLITYPMPQPSAPLRLTRQTWRKCLGNRVWQNRQDQVRVQDGARKLLAIARTLSCQCRQGDLVDNLSQANIFPFSKLPTEVRQRIVAYLCEDGCLSSQQMETVISFASDRSTIGYGQRSAQQGLPPLAIRAVEQELNVDDGDTMQEKVGQSTGLLLHRQWRWREMCSRLSVPRDWPATILDEFPAAMPIPGGGSASNGQQDEFGGGGGPDGQGGSSTDGNGARVSKAGRSWLNEQPGLHAFWEATATHSADQ